MEELKTYKVELIRPPVEDMDIDNISGNHINRLKQDDPDIKKESQDTISLDTKDKRYVSYTRIIKKEIMRHWRYPPEARAYLLEGTLTVIFSLACDGSMTSINIIDTSGHKILDEEVIRAIKTAVPFPEFPGSITVKKLNINAKFDYRLTSEKKDS